MRQLQAALSGDTAATTAATKTLQAVGGTPGVATCLLQIGLAQHVAFGIRQLALLVRVSRAAVLWGTSCNNPALSLNGRGVHHQQVLRQHIRAHWTPEAHLFREPAIQDPEKAATRAQLPQGLADADSKLRTAVRADDV